MRRGRTFLIWYFLIIGALAVVACIPTGALMVLLITAMGLPLFGLPGLVVITAPTILIYSVSLVPLWLALTDFQRRTPLILVTALIPLVVATLPGLTSRLSARAFATKMSHHDFVKSAAAKPKTIELSGDFMSGLFQQNGFDKYAACPDICQRLLFGGEVERVRMFRTSDVYMNRRQGTTYRATYHLEHRDSCPDFPSGGMQTDKAVRDRLVAGDCLIAETGEETATDATVSFLTTYSVQHYPSKPPAGGPDTIQSVKELRIGQAGRDPASILLRTQTIAQPYAFPFYIGAEMHMQGGYNGPTLGRVEFVMNPIDVAQVLRDTFGFKLAKVSAAAGAPIAIAQRVLSLPPAQGAFSVPQQQVLDEALILLAAKPALNDDEVALIKRIIADERIDNGKIGITFLAIFRKHGARLRPLIPTVITRLKVPVPERNGHYQNSLGWALYDYPAEDLAPYRGEIAAILEAQPDWPTTGLLSRIAEIDPAPADLIARRLASKSGSVRKFAGLAACRASESAWPALEPIVLDHLAQSKGTNRLQDEDQPLMLALIRFGKKAQVVEMIEASNVFDKQGALKRVNKLEEGFSPQHCRDGL